MPLFGVPSRETDVARRHCWREVRVIDGTRHGHRHHQSQGSYLISTQPALSGSCVDTLEAGCQHHGTMALKAIFAAAAGVGVLVGGVLGYLAWARAKGLGQITHPDIHLGNAGPVGHKRRIHPPRDQ
jgi:hypothetical protein